MICSLLYCFLSPYITAKTNNTKVEDLLTDRTVETTSKRKNNIIDYHIEQTINSVKKTKKWKKGYIKQYTSVRKKPKQKSKVLFCLNFNTKVKYYKVSKKWIKIKYKNKQGYIFRNRIRKKSFKCKTYSTPRSKLISYMSYKTITNTSSNQYKLQKIAYTGKYGIRQVNGRFCIAVGSYYTTKIGTYIDLILKNGTVIPCILADCKDDKHTDSRNILTYDGSLAEFIVDTNNLVYDAKFTGNIHNVCTKWQSQIVKIKIYNKTEKY